MKTKISFLFLIILTLLQASALDLSLERGWNLISTPFDTLSTDSLSDYLDTREIFSLEVDHYSSSYELTSGTGYWVMSRTYQTITISGDMDSCITPSIKRGWNMAGSPNQIYSVSDYMDAFDEPDSFVTPLYYYETSSGAYQEVDYLYPGMGFWAMSRSELTNET